jgi:hypothetical protein
MTGAVASEGFWNEGMDEVAIRATDFAGIVPASRGAHCRPLHPRLASLCCPGTAVCIGPGAFRRAGADG